MNTIDFLDDLKATNIRLSLDGETIKCSAPQGAVTATIKEELRSRKSDIISFLQSIKESAGDRPQQAINNSSTDFSEASSEVTAPLVLSPEKNQQQSLCDWAAQNTKFIEIKLLEHGAILFRGFKVNGVAEFEQFIVKTADEPLPYDATAVGMKRRPSILRNIYEPTAVNHKDFIPMHNECSFADSWPGKIYFHCLEPAQKRGQTSIADARRILKAMPQDIREHFQEKKILYVRNFSNGQWQKVFGVETKQQVEQICHKAGSEVEWLSGDRLRTKTVYEAIVEHEKTGEKLWFNHVYQANITSLNPEVRSSLLNMFSMEDLPRNTYYGDGSKIETSVLHKIRQAYDKEKILFDWQKGDVLMLDNMSFVHGREPFVPPRRIAVGMAQPIKRRLCKG